MKKLEFLCVIHLVFHQHPRRTSEIKIPLREPVQFLSANRFRRFTPFKTIKRDPTNPLFRKHKNQPQHRPIRDRSDGHHSVEPAAATGHHGATPTGSGHPARSGHPGRRRHRQVRDGARGRGLPAGGILLPEGQPVPGEEFLSDSVRWHGKIRKSTTTPSPPTVSESQLRGRGKLPWEIPEHSSICCFWQIEEEGEIANDVTLLSSLFYLYRVHFTVEAQLRNAKLIFTR